MEQQQRLLRSWMFVPGDRQRMIDKALTLDADAIMIDIEDGVAPAEKENARIQIAASLDKVAERLEADPDYRTPARFVRTNQAGTELMVQDFKAAVRPGLDGLVISKVDTVEQVRRLAHNVAAPLFGQLHVNLGSAFPGRRVQFIDAMVANWVGGGAHCATLSQPIGLA